MKEVKLREVVEAYRASRDYQALAPATKRNTEKSVAKVAHYMHRPFTRLTKGVLTALMDDMTAGNAFVFATRMRAMFAWAVERDLIAANPMEGVRLPKQGEYRPWDVTEISAFLDNPEVDKQVRMAILLAFYTAQRMSDVLKMRWDDIKNDSLYVRQQKTGTELLIPIHEKLKWELAKHPREGDTIISMGGQGPYSPETFRRKFSRSRDDLNLPNDLTFHGLRKTIAATLASRGATLQQIMGLGGWKSPRQAMGYCKGADQYAMAKAALSRL